MSEGCSARASRTRLIQHDSILGQWELVTRLPDPSLHDYVREFEGYRETRSSQPIRRREVPWPGTVLIINFESPFRLTDPRHGAGPADFGSFVAGLYDSYVVTESVGLSYCMQVNFTPIGARRFFRLPMNEIANRTVNFEDLIGVAARRLSEQLQECPSWDARFALLETFVATRIHQGSVATPQMAWAWQQLQLPGADRRIGELARELGWSPRHLIASFREQVGLAPKTLARIVRFHRVIRWLVGMDTIRWAEIAYRAGYYDQAHFNRDFREFAGTAPGEYLRRYVPGGGVMEQ